LEANKQSSPTAENALKQEAAKPQYSLSLLNIVNSDSLPLKTRLAAALAFKNFIRTSYVVRLSQTRSIVFEMLNLV
jgi:exportin-2 (importin alpha re-exporter)